MTIAESENKIRQLEKELEQAKSVADQESQEEINRLENQLKQEREEKNRFSERLKDVSKKELNSWIQDAIDALEHALKNTDKQIENNENAARLFKFFGIGLFVIGIILLIAFRFVSPPDSLPTLLFYTFPIITLMLIGTTCLRHQKNLLGEIRHFSNMKHQIELYSGLLKASLPAAASYYEPEKAGEYVQETFTQIRNRLLSNPYLPDNLSTDKQSDNDFGSDKVLDLLNKIADLSGKKSMGN